VEVSPLSSLAKHCNRKIPLSSHQIGAQPKVRIFREARDDGHHTAGGKIVALTNDMTIHVKQRKPQNPGQGKLLGILHKRTQSTPI
jgi:hypothetical protein